MRLTLLVLGLLLVPTALALPPASLTPPLPSNASVLPLNAVTNGGFESGLANWARYGGASHALPVISPGAAATARAFSSVNEYIGGGIYQPITPTASVGADTLLDFYAKGAFSAAARGNNAIIAMSHWNPATGSGQVTVSLNFHGTQIAVIVWGGMPVQVAAPADGAWHHYQVALVGATGIGVLLIDGVPALDGTGLPALATGTPANVDPANLVLLGDTAYCDCSNGPAPSVVYDEIYLGPQL